MQVFLLMVEICRRFFVWGDMQAFSSYGGNKQTVPVMVEICRLFFLWWR